MNRPSLSYFLSDTFGPEITDPRQADKDADVYLETDLSRLEDVLRHGGDDELKQFQAHEKINIRGRELAVAQHIVRLLQGWHVECRKLIAERKIYNGLFVNFAPRTEENRNGSNFYIAETDSGLRIVTTPLEVLDPIANYIKHLERVPNEDSGLFENGTQFRSKSVHNALRWNRQYNTEPAGLEELNPNPATKELRVRYVDIYGNIVAYGGDQTELAERLVEEGKRHTKLGITMNGVQLEGEAAVSMAQARPGNIVVYPNGGAETQNIDVIRKWNETRESAYEIFKGPKEGEAQVAIEFLS